MLFNVRFSGCVDLVARGFVLLDCYASVFSGRLNIGWLR